MERFISQNNREKPVEVRTSLPRFFPDGISTSLRNIEGERKPENLTETFSRMTEYLEGHIRYDALNYALGKEFPSNEPQGGFIDKVDTNKLRISEEQKTILQKTILDLEKVTDVNPEERGILRRIREAINTNDYKTFVKEIVDSNALKGYFLSDDTFTNSWMKTYDGRTILSIMQGGVGSCKTVSVLAKMLLESGNTRWGLGIESIDIIEDDEFHVYLVIHTKSGTKRIYDPSEIFYKK